MRLEDWLAAAVADAESRGLPELRPLLETLARATAMVRRAPWNETAASENAADRSPADPARPRDRAAEDTSPDP